MVQRRALRYFLGTHRFIPLIVVEVEYGWMNCFFRQKNIMLRLWNRFASMENERLTKGMSVWEQAQNNQPNWTPQNIFLTEINHT